MNNINLQEKFSKLSVFALLLLILLVYAAFSCFTIVGAGERGVKVQLGAVQDQVLDEGLHFKIPFIDKIQIIDVKIQKIQTEVDAASKDLQMVETSFALNYHVNPDMANEVYQEFRYTYEEAFIQPAIEEAVKAITAQFTAEELITQRTAVNEQILALLKTRLGSFGFQVDAVSIVDFGFSDSFNEAIEAKVTAEQNALKAENELKQAEFEAQKLIVQAQAQAESIRIQIESLQVQGGESYVELMAVEKWDGELPVYMLGDTIPFLSIPSAE